ncbi:MAG: ribose-5-phosphate isomerase [Parcubacteria group bacterium CG10_big_fil_rev_8_21_14_0_10_36_14]|nr:MAG: ribose-5-phosphate isomerase [Parcubacteria group bacterium CG10_big_fil_rev_8_21_14_0_10_36_14]
MIYLGSDHAGFKLKQAIKRYLSNHGYEYEDLGNLKLDEKDDYPDFGARVAQGVAINPKKNKGILVCGSAEGMGMVANKFKGARAAVVYDKESAKLSREHNDANVLSISGWKLSEQKVRAIVKEFLETKFSGEKRHKRRLEKIRKIEKVNFR